MHVHDLFESDDDDHAAKLKKTGFWGAQGAGCVFVSRTTKKFLLAHRSRAVEQPGTWGTWGGAIDKFEMPHEAVRREAEEESGYDNHIDLIPLYVFEAKKDGKTIFRYHNFLAIIDDEFVPKLNWETQGYIWCEFGNWPAPLHFGFKSLLDDPASVQIMKRFSDQEQT